MNEKYCLRKGFDLTTAEISPETAFILSRLGSEKMSLSTIQSVTGIDPKTIAVSLYRSWFLAASLPVRMGFSDRCGSVGKIKCGKLHIENFGPFV